MLPLIGKMSYVLLSLETERSDATHAPRQLGKHDKDEKKESRFDSTVTSILVRSYSRIRHIIS